MALKIVNKNILMALADVVVNSANPEPVMAQHGVEREIYENAGAQELLQERARIGKIDYGWVEETPSFKLSGQNIKRIYHAVCCPWVDGNSFEEETLKCCYLNALRKMKADACESISFAELCYIYRNKEAINKSLSAIGGKQMYSDYYWSSSQKAGSSSYAWCVTFNNGYITDYSLR